MNWLLIGLGVIFSVFSTVILSYISIATMVGPWIAPTIVLVGHGLFAIFRRKGNRTADLMAIQAIASGGGIIATGVGFALPMLHFMEPESFAAWLASPTYFCVLISLLCLIAGALGLWFGSLLVKPLVDQQQLPFPVSSLTYQVAASENHPQQTSQLVMGVGLTGLVCVLRDGIKGWVIPLIHKAYHVLPSFLGKEVALSIWPTLWAIGLSVGLPITIPLLIGLASKYLVIFPLAQHALYLPFSLFPPLPPETLSIAFCSGLVASELIVQVPTFIKALKKQSKGGWLGALGHKLATLTALLNSRKKGPGQLMYRVSLGVMLVAIFSLLSHFSFSIASQILMVTFTLAATYSICQIGGKIGMVPFGRFSTFIVVPLLILFGLSPVQATITCVFFDICAASASDLLFDIKGGDLAGIDRKKMFWYQWIGLIATSLCMGVVLWLLFTHLQLGSEELFAQRGKAKALLLQSLNFNPLIVLMGAIFGMGLKKLKINGTMVFGGIIMPNSVTLGLVMGSLGTLLTDTPEKFQPLCGGILAAESLWIMAGILLGFN